MLTQTVNMAVDPEAPAANQSARLWKQSPKIS